MKKLIIILIILLSGALTFFIYSITSERSPAPIIGEIKKTTTEKNSAAVHAKSPSGIEEEHLLSQEKEIKETITNKEGMEKTAEKTVLKEETVKTVKQNIEDARPRDELNEKVEKPSALLDEAPLLEIKRAVEIKPVAKGMAEPVEKKEPVLKEETSGGTEKIERAAKDETDRTKPVDKSVSVPAEIPPLIMKDENKIVEIKRAVEIKPVAKGMAGPAEKKEPVLKVEASGETEKIERAAKDETDRTKSVDKSVSVPAEIPPLIMKDENKVSIMREGIKQPIKKPETVTEDPPLIKEKKETMPAGGLIKIPHGTPAPALIESSSMGTKDITNEKENEQHLVMMEAAVAGSRTAKTIETKEVIPAAAKKDNYMEKPESFSTVMLKKEGNKRVAIFPFENLSENKDAFKHVLPLLIDKLENKGLEVMDEDDLSSFLCKDRIRYSGYISKELLGKIRKRYNISTILTGAIISFSAEEIPQFGVLARMIDTSDGSILWADYYAATGDDFIAILELGRLKTVFSLIPKVIDILFASFKVEELYKEIRPAHRIAVMPFKNNSNFNNAGTIATYMFIVELLKSREFMPIEYGDVREVIIKLGIRRKGDIDYGNIGALSKALRVRGILVGVVDNYSDGVAASAAPNVGITARLIDSSNNNILWYNSSQLSGEEGIIALDWGRIRSVHSVAYKAISSLVKEMSKKKWRE